MVIVRRNKDKRYIYALIRRYREIEGEYWRHHLKKGVNYSRPMFNLFAS